MSGGVLATTVAVDWGSDDVFTDAYDDVTRDVFGEPGVSTEYGLDTAQTYSPPMVPAADFELLNESARYSPENPSSPIYQLIAPGKEVHITGVWGERRTYRNSAEYRSEIPYRGVVTQRLASGLISEIEMTTRIGDRRVRIGVIGLSSRLRGRTVSVAIQTNIRTDQALALVLDAADWPSGDRDISAGDTTMLYWWADERDAWDLCVELLATEGTGAALYEDGDGVLHFENRGYRAVTTRSTSSQAAFFDTDGGDPLPYRTHRAYRSRTAYRGRASGLWYTDLVYEPGWRNIVNRATYATKRRTLAALGVVWSYGATLSLAASQSVTIIARPSVPFLNAVTPALTTDYTVSGGTVSVSLSYTSGAVAYIVVTATSGTPTVSGLQLRAQALNVASESVVQNSVDASGSISRYGVRSLQLDGWPEVDTFVGEAICNAAVSRRSVQRPIVTITLVNADDSHLAQIMTRLPSDRITIAERSSRLSADVWIESRSVVVDGAGGRRVTCVLVCEKCADLTGAVWDGLSSLWDTAVWSD